MNSNKLTRRSLIRGTSLLAAGAVVARMTGTASAAIDLDKVETVVTKGRINQSVSQWCYKWSLDELCQVSKKLGLKAIDLLGPNDFATVKKYGLIVSMVNSHPLTDGLADKKFHEACLAKLRETIDATSSRGVPQRDLGSRATAGASPTSDRDRETPIEALKKIAGYAEQKKVTICLEYLNSVGHKDYMFDHIAWGVELCKRVGIGRVKSSMTSTMRRSWKSNIHRRRSAGTRITSGTITPAAIPGATRSTTRRSCTIRPDHAGHRRDRLHKGYVAHEFVPKGHDTAARADLRRPDLRRLSRRQEQPEACGNSRSPDRSS